MLLNINLNILNLNINIIKLLCILLLITTIMVLLSKNTINSIFFLILSFINSANILIFNNIEYLAILFIIIYVGAIAVLFLFVIMLLNIKSINIDNNFKKFNNFLIIFYVLILIFIQIFNSKINSNFLFLNNYIDFYNLKYLDWSEKFINTNSFQNIAESLYNFYSIEIIFSSFLLLIPMISAILITLKKNNFLKKQLFFLQINRKIKNKIKRKIIIIF